MKEEIEDGNVLKFVHKSISFCSWHIGYEPAGHTVHPPPQNNREWVNFFRMGV